jgi:hypothetical protein
MCNMLYHRKLKLEKRNKTEKIQINVSLGFTPAIFPQSIKL